MPNLGGVWGFSSMFSLATLILSLYSVAISSRMGAIILQGPHHSAQKSSSTGFSDFRTSWENVASVVCTICGLLTRFNLRWEGVQKGWFWEQKRPLERVGRRKGRHDSCKLCKKAVPETPVKRLHYEVFSLGSLSLGIGMRV